ncbi:hypothetical protein OPV22_021534 [Ensete ventricosum]|uniref:Calmodulin-binding domain-containing protein n=1 Tax=Ensete ventricosum TaxID=4639 RepID=A0AAV8QHC2_ENSVE|nr:hypothetical protein OPV22_021534 [Ensete ventricosum]RWW42871.1 hypothetical protein BHE74_00051539 [Ensete ventricosum]
MKPGGVKVSSSPGREKLPPAPGLARLLYGKAVGSRSRGRSASASTVARSSPMFASRSRSRGRSSSAAAAAAKEGGEPSSPKVTCIGEVRIRNKRSAKPNKPQPKKTRSKSSLMPCRCLHKSLLCGLFPVRKRPTGRGGRRSLWPRWSRVRSGGSGGYQQQKSDPVKPLPQPEFITSVRVSDREEDGDDKDEDDEEAARHGEKTKVFEPLATATPPKTALLLMRCRSAPHNRSSSLATSQITVSPLLSPDSPAAPPLEEVSGGKAGDEELLQQQEQRTSSSGGALIHEEDEEEEQGDEAKGSESRRPLVLPRSKSEPAMRAAAKLAVPEASYCFWTSRCQRRRSVPAHEERAPPTLNDV